MRAGAGSLRHRVTIQYPDATRDDYGQPIVTWRDLATVWANVKNMTGTAFARMEFETAGVEVSRATTSIRIRMRDDVTHDMRVKHRGRLYEIKAVLNDEDWLDTTHLACTAVASGDRNG